MNYRNPKDLKVHPIHARIYLPGDTQSLEVSLKNTAKMHHPIDITPDGFILGGLRRTIAAINVGMPLVPVTEHDDLLSDEDQGEFIMDDNQHRVKIWLEKSNEVREKRALKEKRQGHRSDRTDEEAINTRKEIAEALGMKENVVRVLEMIASQPEHRELLMRDMEHNTINKLETDYKKRLTAAGIVDEEEFPVVDLEPQRCPTCHAQPVRIITDYANRRLLYADESEDNMKK